MSFKVIVLSLEHIQMTDIVVKISLLTLGSAVI